MNGTRPRSETIDNTSDYKPVKFFKLDNGRVAAENPPTTPASDLESLLNLSNVPTADIPRRFEAIAEALIQHYRLKIKSGGVATEYQILEMEFYLKDAQRHWDPFAHGEAEQSVPGRWYFHRAPRRGKSPEQDSGPVKPPAGYRGGTRKGLDLTFGGPVRNSTLATNSNVPGPQTPRIKGGILLRSLRRETDDRVISGPSLLVDEIISRSGASDLKDLVAKKWSGRSDAFPPSDPEGEASSTSMLIVRHSVPPDRSVTPIYTSPRIGLDLSNTSDADARVDMVDRPYRFFTQPHLLVANGRGHTFTGLFRSQKVSAEHPYTELVAELALLTGLSDAVVKRYMQFYEAGRSTRVEAYVGAKGKGVSGSPEKLLKMLGALERKKEEGEGSAQVETDVAAPE